MYTRLSALFVAVLLIAGCTTRSISNSGYSRGYYGGSSLYQGELSEFDVLGVKAGRGVSDEEISRALAERKQRITLHKGDPVLLIQSGAIFPDEEMIAHLEKTFSVTVFTGIPEREDAKDGSYSDSLRLAAARGGIPTLIVYWGVLESGSENLATKTVSWVPVIGYGVPDESQHMRIRLKVAVVDVETGQWEIFTPETFGEKAFSARATRRSADQGQVATLKSKAYEQAANELSARYVR